MEKQENFRLTDPARCCGCGACAAACPVDAITMEPKTLGAIYPEVNMDKCISCGKCRKVCVFEAEDKLQNVPLKTYAAANTDSSQQKKSASGGVFAALARGFLSQGGVVYGCSMEYMDGKLTPIHICVESETNLPKLQGSKYVQSKTTQCFKEIKAKLQDGKCVFFSGTPCQVAALKYYLKNDNTENLFTADLICHGTPGTELFQEYVDYLEKQKKIKIIEFSFRDKSLGWGLMACYRIKAKSDKQKTSLLSPQVSSYYSLFLESETYRESCYSCPWAKTTRVGDVTLGDYWGVETEHPEYLRENGGKLSTETGVSALLVNTPQGEQLIDQHGHGLTLELSDLERVVKWNIQLQKPSQHTVQRDEILACYAENGYSGVEKCFRKKQGLRYYIRYAKSKIKEARAKK